MHAARWVMLASVLAAGPAFAAVTPAQFPPQTVGDLLALCTAGKDDPMMTAAVNFCGGYVEGAVTVQEAHMAHQRRHRLFCISEPRPSHDQALAAFTTWVHADPTRMNRPALDGLFEFLAETYPCTLGTQ